MQTVYLSKEIEESIASVIDFAKKYTEASVSKESLLSLQNVNFKNKCEKSIYDSLYSFALKCESLSPGAAEIFFNHITKSEKAFHSTSVSVEALNKKNIELVLQTFSSPEIKALVFEALNLAGLKGKVLLSTTNSSTDLDVVELTAGSFFSDVHSAFELPSTKFFHAKILCIDGYVESVSEFHRILEDASSSKETLIIFLRGMSEDVLHTLKINYDRGTLRVIPIITKFDVDGVNLLNDIAVVSGCDVVSSLKGQLISSIDISNLSRADVVDITSSGVLIENHSTMINVDRHISFLQKKILNAENDETTKILTKRIQQLGTNRVSIKLVDDRLKSKKSFMIDRCLRAVKSASTHGVACYNDRSYPFSSIVAAELYAKKFFEFIKNLGAALV